MPPELYAEEYETGLGMGAETTFRVLANPAMWVPGKCDLAYEVGYRDVSMPIGEKEQTHLSQTVHTCDGKIACQVCPGHEGLYFGEFGLLSWRDYIRPRSFSAIKCMGSEEAAYYRGLCVDDFTLKSTKGEDMGLDLGVKGTDEEIGAAWVPNYADLKSPYILEELDLYVAGQQRVNFESIEITENRDLRADIYGTSLVRVDMTSKGVKRTIKLDGFRQKHLNTLRIAHLNGIEVTFAATWTRGAASITGTAGRCLVRKCDVDNVKEPVELQVLKVAGSGVAGLVWS